MKRILLFSFLIVCAFLSKAQTANFDNTYPEKWLVNPELKIAAYNSPKSNECADDIGLVAAAAGNTNSLYLLTTGAEKLPKGLQTIVINFDFFAFNASANFKCATPLNNLSCKTSLTAYLVPEKYTNGSTPGESNIYGQGTVQISVKNPNTLTIQITKALNENAKYRLYVEGKLENCNGNAAQIFVLDNISMVGGASQDFNNLLPAGWIFNKDMAAGAYRSSNKCADNLGLITPPIALDNNIHIATSPATNYSPTTGSFNVSFDLFAFKFNPNSNGTSCANSDNSLYCSTKAKVYLVAGSYEGSAIPTGTQIIGQSNIITLKPGTNTVSVPVIGNLDPAKQYRLFIEGITSGCQLSANKTQYYVLDNFKILEIERATLPVTFKSFTANRSNSSAVALVWETAMEENNRGFHVQRNIDGNWKNVAFVFSQADGGNSNAVLRYSYNDINTSKGISQYRILQVDMDGTGKYSEIRSVKGEGLASKVLVYPNPSHTGSINVMFDDATSVRDVIVSDVAGRVVKQFRAVSSNSLVIENLVDGYYTLQITNQTTAATTVEKVIIKKR